MTSGSRTPLAIARSSTRRTKSCWRAMRPKSLPPSSVQVEVSPGTCWYCRWRLLAYASASVGFERVATGPGHVDERVRAVDQRVVVADAGVEVDRDAAHRLDEPLERGEVDLDVVVDRDVEVLLDRGDQRLRPGRPLAAEPDRRVDLLVDALAGDLHPEVARQRQQRRRPGLGVDVEDHDRVAARTGDVAAPLQRGVVGGEPEVAVGADDQEVLRRTGRRVRLGQRARQREALHVGQLGVGVPEPCRDRQRDADDDHVSHDDQPLGPTSPTPARAECHSDEAIGRSSQSQ